MPRSSLAIAWISWISLILTLTTCGPATGRQAPAPVASPVAPTGSATAAPPPVPTGSTSPLPTPTLQPAAPSATPGTTFSRTFTFRDESNDNNMIVSIDPGARDGGHFAFQIGGKSVVSGFGTLAVTPSGSLTLAFDGPATLQPTLDFGAPSATPAFSSRPVTISLRATIAGDYRSADATLAIGADRHMLTVRLPDPRGVPDVLSAIEAAFLNDDPRALYPLLNVDLRSANTVDQFETQWRTQSLGDGRRIVGLTRGEIGAVELLSIGWAVVRVAYRLDTRRTTGSSTTASEMVLIHERSGWKLWMTSER